MVVAGLGVLLWGFAAGCDDGPPHQTLPSSDGGSAEGNWPGGTGGEEEGTDGGPAGEGGCIGEACAGATRSLELAAQHLLGDPDRGVFYATVQGDADSHPNELLMVSRGGAVVENVPIGSDPGAMGMSDDGSTLWVALDGEFGIRRVDLATGSLVPGESYALPTAPPFDDTVAAGEIVVLPGTTDSVAVSLHRWGVSPSFSGVVILDDGVPREGFSTPGHTGAAQLCTATDGFLFGFNNLHTGFGFYSIEIAATELVQQEFDGLINGFGSDIVCAADRVFSTGGEVVDISDPSAPVRDGKFAFAGAIVPRADGESLYMLSGGRDGTVLRGLELGNFTATFTRELHENYDADRFRDLVWAGPGQLAVIADDYDENRVFIIAVQP